MKDEAYEIEVARSVLRLANRIIANRNRHINELGITTAQADSLRFFEEHSHAGIKDLRDYLGVKHQTAQGIVQRLLEKGMIASSISDTDGRCKEIVLTDAGIQMLKNLSVNGSHTGKKLLFGMSKEQQKLFGQLIQSAYDNINKGEI